MTNSMRSSLGAASPWRWSLLAPLGGVRAPRQAERRDHDRGSGVDRARGRRRSHHGRVDRKGYQDPHFVEAKPSFILKLQKADLLIVVGRELEIGWLPPLIQQSRNAKVQVGADGYLDASQGARILEIPTGQITRAMGDVHPHGNPHYWLDPENGKRIAKEIADKLSELRPDDRAYFEQRLADFRRAADRRREEVAGRRWRRTRGRRW